MSSKILCRSGGSRRRFRPPLRGVMFLRGFCSSPLTRGAWRFVDPSVSGRTLALANGVSGGAGVASHRRRLCCAPNWAHDASRWLASNRDLFSCQRAGRTPRGARRRGRIVATGYSLIQSVRQGLLGRSLGSKYAKSLGNPSDRPGSDSENVVDRQHHVVNVATLVFTIHRLSKAIGTSDRRI